VILERTQSPLVVPIICYYNKSTMKITFDAAKREKNRDEKGLDFARAAEVFEGTTAIASGTWVLAPNDSRRTAPLAFAPLHRQREASAARNPNAKSPRTEIRGLLVYSW
jgi:hypothetical protein